MADISQVSVNDVTYGICDGIARSGYELIEDTRSSNVAAMTGVSSRLTGLTNGTRILFHLHYASAASTTLNLTLVGGSTTGAKKVYRQGTTQLAANLGIAGCILPLTYLTSLDSGNGGWMMDNDYDSNTNTIGYQLRTNSTTLPTTDRTRYYRMLFESADGKKWIPANTQYDNSNTSLKTVNQRKINPFGRIVYLDNGTNYAADVDIPATAIWSQYLLTLGYSFNRTGAALTLTTKTPVYLKCAPQTDGSAIMDSTEPIVQTLPTTADGKIYIYLGIATSTTQLELYITHPVYYHDGTRIRLFTDAASGGTSSGGTWAGAAMSGASEADKEATVDDGFSLAAGSMVYIYMLYGNSVTASGITLDVNDTGAIPVSVGIDPTSSSVHLPWNAGDILGFVYAPDNSVGVWEYIEGSTALGVHGIPSGGTSGQVLAKSSATDYDVGWVNQSGGVSLLDVYPVGSIYMSVNNTNPSTLFGGTWVQIEDTFLLAAGSTYTAGDTGGEATHTLTAAESGLPAHTHDFTQPTVTTKMEFLKDVATGTAKNRLTTQGQSSPSYTSDFASTVTGGAVGAVTGGAQNATDAHNNMPPYLAVYVWKRTA